MAELQLTPALRFPEFENPLSSSKLEDIASFSKGKGISKADIEEDGALECIRYGELYTHYNEIIDKVYSKTNVPAVELVLSEANDVIIPASGETQIDIATASCVLREGIALGGDLNIIKSAISGIYLSYYLNNARKTNIARLAQGISVVHLYSSQLKTLSFNLPSPEEQQKIASFLTAVDERIQLLQKKKAKLEEYKKGVMQKLFSQEIRFKPAPSGVEGDANGHDTSASLSTSFPDWEEKKLGEIVQLRNGYAFKSSTYTENGQFRIITISNVQDGELNVEECKMINLLPDDLKGHQILKEGDLLVSLTGNVGRIAIVNHENCLLNQRVGKLEIDEKTKSFLFQLLRRGHFLNNMVSLAQGGAQPNLSKRDIDNYKIALPAEEEQQKIASFLSSLDEAIKKTARQIEATTTFKKGLLQNMFV